MAGALAAPWGLLIADKGTARALWACPHLSEGLNIHDGMVTHKAVAEALRLRDVPACEALKA